MTSDDLSAAEEIEAVREKDYVESAMWTGSARMEITFGINRAGNTFLNEVRSMGYTVTDVGFDDRTITIGKI